MTDIHLNDIPKEEWEEAIRRIRGKSRRSSDCKHEGKIHPMDGCEFCGDMIVRISYDLFKRLRKLGEHYDYNV